MTASENQSNQLISTGALLANTWKIYKDNHRLILGYAAWPLVPFVAHLLISISFSQEIADISLLVNSIMEIILILWVSVLIIKITPELKAGKTKKVNRIASQSWKLIIPYALASIVLTVIIALGTILLIIPGILFFTWFLFTKSVVVIENATLFDSFKKSKQLITGRAFTILGQYLGGEFVIGFLLLLALFAFYAILGPLNGVSFEVMLKSPPTVMGQTIEYILSLVFLPAILIFETLLYLSVKDSR